MMVNQVDVKRVTDQNFRLVAAMFRGYGRALRACRLVNITGEFAVMKHQITAFCDRNSDKQLILTVDGSCVGLTSKKLLLSPKNIKPDMVVVGLWDPGYRCNGGTFLTNVLLEKFGPDIASIWRNPEAMDFVRKICVPSQVYTPLLTALCGWNPDGTVNDPLAEIIAMMHITGGGIWGKVAEVMPDGVGMDLYDMLDPAPVLLQAQRYSEGGKHELSDKKAYGTLHGGCGMLVVCADKAAAEIVIALAARRGIKAGIVGKTMASKAREVVIKSRFRQKTGKTVSSLDPD